ncbi:MAG: C25 family cysteine peptidase, partial [bacterium]|nr:C25 family cysteine peptidase [bacterium]
RTLVKYGGRVFTKIEFPRVGSLAGSGFSEGKEWFQFPSRLTAPSLSSSRYSNALAIRINQPIFPADLMKLERWPSRAEEMSSLGIDPLGARPMIPTIAGFFCAMGQGDGEDVTISAERFGILNQRFEYPLVPAGFTGEDQAQEDAGYTPPQLVDEEFYNSFKGTFDGLGKGVRRFGTIGFFPTVESYVPLIQVHTGNDISVPQEIYVTVRQNKGVLPTDFRKRISMVSWDEWVNKPSFVNGNSLVSKLSELGVAIEAIRTAHYLILTPESYVPSLSEFITWKQSKGLLVKTVIVGSGTGADVAADRNAIDAYLENYYNTWSNKTIYVLLIGDVDVIPSGRTSKINAGPDYSDADSDHVYGVIGNENIAKLYVGRLSCNSTGELQNQLDKILSYERGDVRGSWPRQVTLCANSQNDDGSYGVSSSHPSKYAAAVNTIANYMGYSNPPTFQVLHAGASNNTTPRATNQDVINAINAGRGQVLYRGHGSSSAWSSGWDGSSTTGNSFDHPTDVNQLTNTIYPIVYSIACQNNRLRVSDCVGEAWMSSEHGAVAYWGATVNSWTTENHQRALSIFRSIYEYNNETLGPALANAEYLSYLSSSGSDSWQSNTFCYLLLGDPELSIRKNSLLLTLEFIPHITPLRQGSQLTLLNENKEPLVGQLVSVKVYGLEERISGYTNQAGELILDGVDQSRIEDIQLFSRDYSWVRKQFEIVIPTPTPVTSYADPIWVDRHATGAQLGTTDQPFHSISAAMAVAVTHTIRVRQGIYTESVVLKDGVKLIGEGFERTVIDLSGTGTAVTATNTGNTTLLSGFRIQNAERGIVCTNASPTLQENYITHINPTSLNSDGITLTNSSPLIRHNVIYHVGGMGIRGQGNSQPQIINNTIVDYRYYAGISFAALDIGAVAPVIKNNIIARGNTETVGGILWKIPASPQLSYNTVFDPASVASGSSHYAESDGAGTWTEKSGGLGALESDPLFVNAALGIFTLSNFSPCIDAGDPAAVYNDLDGSRNDMGAFGGKRAEAGGGYHLGSGFLFTSVGKIPVSSIVQDEANPSFGLAQVSTETATQFSIPAFMDSPFGGHLWIRGLFGIDDDIDYYRIVATPLDGNPAFDLKDPLTKTLTTFALDGTPIYQQIQLGPTNVGGIDNLYKMNKTGYWSQQDLRMIWNTTGLNGRYRLQVIGYRELSPGNLTMVPLPWNEQSEMVLWLDNMPVQVQIENVFYANGDPLVECEDILFPHAGSEQLLFQIQAYHPNGFLDYVLLDAWWGENKYGGQLTQEQYVGENDTLPPLWYGYYDELLPPLSPVGSNGLPMEWEDCAYRFRLYARARTTDGTGYLHWNTYNVYHAIETGVPVVAALATQTDDCPTCPV